MRFKATTSVSLWQWTKLPTNCAATIPNRTPEHKQAGSNRDRERPYKECISLWQSPLRFWDEVQELLEQSILNFGNLHRRRAFWIVVRHAIDAGAHRIASHQTSIVGPQQVGRRSGSPSCPLDPIPQRRTSEEIDPTSVR